MIALDEAAEAQSEGSSLRKEFQARAEYIGEARAHQGQQYSFGWPAWWTSFKLDPTASSGQGNESYLSGTTETNGAASGISVAGKTCGSDLEGKEIGECGTSTSRRR